MSAFLFKIIFGVLSIILIIIILIQQKNSSLGSMMGGGGESGEQIAQTRRGAERFLHTATVFLATIFIGFGLYGMFFYDDIFLENSANVNENTININGQPINIKDIKDAKVTIDPPKSSGETSGEKNEIKLTPVESIPTPTPTSETTPPTINTPSTSETKPVEVNTPSPTPTPVSPANN